MQIETNLLHVFLRLEIVVNYLRLKHHRAEMMNYLVFMVYVFLPFAGS